jgi:hypothetical protein
MEKKKKKKNSKETICGSYVFIFFIFFFFLFFHFFGNIFISFNHVITSVGQNLTFLSIFFVQFLVINITIFLLLFVN